MYKDKDKQREANRKAQAKFKAKGITKQGIIPDGELPKGITESRVLPPPGLPTLDESLTDDTTKPNQMPSPELQAHCAKVFAKNFPKRGKDIKCFADLPPDVQKTIDRMSINKDGTVNQTVKANRTAIAISYQHIFPDRYYSTGVA